jgi:hypothetical protein
MVMPMAGKEAQLDATAVQDVAGEVATMRDRADESADNLADAFGRGLEMALNTDGPLRVDDSTPEGSEVASALARYLVATDLAASTSAELSNGHYVYSFEVDWPRLREVANAAGVTLPGTGGAGA